MEDEPDWRNKLEAILECKGCQVKTAASYGEALGKLCRDSFHLAVVDLNLSPDDEENRDGIILLGDIYDKSIPSIIITGYGTPKLAQEAYEQYGIFSFLEKANFETDKFTEVVEEAIEASPKWAKNKKSTTLEKKEFLELTRKLLAGQIVTRE